MAEMYMDSDHDTDSFTTKKVKVNADETKPGTVPRYGLGPGRALRQVAASAKESGYTESISVVYDSRTNNAARRSREIQKLVENSSKNSTAQNLRLVQLLALNEVPKQTENACASDIIGKLTKTDNLKFYSHQNFTFVLSVQISPVTAMMTMDLLLLQK